MVAKSPALDVGSWRVSLRTSATVPGERCSVSGEVATVSPITAVDVGEARDLALAELDASFALMTLELKNLFEHLEIWFGLPRPGERD